MWYALFAFVVGFFVARRGWKWLIVGFLLMLIVVLASPIVYGLYFQKFTLGALLDTIFFSLLAQSG